MSQIDDMDYPFYLELIDHVPIMEAMEAEMEKEKNEPKFVPIDKVF
ncbi:hypothetical protein P9D51_22890 [Bacillus sonorensis]|nr:hypothetical protein [Bacillus sonorensis]MCY8562214.1 hypothetical protein [Bacillus sonorensis]MEC1428892.1 hypothetical protein [Bacillus sonorensis]